MVFLRTSGPVEWQNLIILPKVGKFSFKKSMTNVCVWGRGGGESGEIVVDDKEMNINRFCNNGNPTLYWCFEGVSD